MIGPNGRPVLFRKQRSAVCPLPWLGGLPGSRNAAETQELASDVCQVKRLAVLQQLVPEPLFSVMENDKELPLTSYAFAFVSDQNCVKASHTS